MNKLFNIIFNRKQAWHVCWVTNISGRNSSYGDGTYTMDKKLNSDAITALREKLADEMTEAVGTKVKPERINITSLTRVYV